MTHTHSEQCEHNHDSHNHTHDHNHNHAHDHNHNYGHNHNHNHNHGIDTQQMQLMMQQQQGEEVPVQKFVAVDSIIKTTNTDGDSVIELDEYNMWNAVSLGEFEFLEQALPRFPFLVDRQDDDGQYMLHWAALHGNIKVASLLLNARSQVDCIAKKTGQTPLLWACTKGNIPMVDFLLKSGADINHRDATGTNALLIATQYKEILTAHFLLRKGVSFVSDNNGCGALHWAAYMNIIPLARLYIAQGFDIDEKDNEGFTPLHRSIFGRCEDMALFLLESGCDTKVTNRSGASAADIMDPKKFSPKLLQKLSKKHKNMFRSPTENPRFFQYFYIVCYTFIFFDYYYDIVTHTLPWFPMTCMVLGTLLAFTGLAYVIVCRSDPGYVGKEAKLDFDNVLDNIEDKNVLQDAQHICFTCDIVKPMRSKHCRFCDKCVYKFDHHCGWIGNCVGKKNHPLFLAFLVVMFPVHVLTLFLGVQAVFLAEVDGSILDKILFFKLLITSMGLNFAGIFITGTLVKDHLKYMIFNETTNEKINWARYPHFWKPFTNPADGRRGVVYSNPFDQNYQKNCEEFCFGVPQYQDQAIYAKLESVRVTSDR